MDMYRNGLTYRFLRNMSNVVIPFGFGLSYTTFAYKNASATKYNFNPCDVIAVTVVVENMGDMSGDEIVQLYVVRSPPHNEVCVCVCVCVCRLIIIRINITIRKAN